MHLASRGECRDLRSCSALRAAIESHLCILINSDVWEKTPDTDNQQLQHLRPLLICSFVSLDVDAEAITRQADRLVWWQGVEKQC